MPGAKPPNWTEAFKKTLQFFLGLSIVVVAGVFLALGLQLFLGMVAAGGGVATSLNTLLAAGLAGVAYLYREQREKRKALEERLVSDKREQYQAYVDVLREVAANTRTGAGGLSKAEQVKLVDRLRQFAFRSILVASDDVVVAHSRFIRVGSGQPGSVALPAIAEVLLAIRRDIGFPNTKLSAQQLLGVFVNDPDELTPYFEGWEKMKADKGQSQ